MNRTGFLYDPRYLLHDTGPYHPEVPERLEAILKGLETGGQLEKLVRISASPAAMEWIESVHDEAYIRRFEAACFGGRKTIDYPDNQMCADTYEIAQLAVGGILDTIDLLMQGEIDNAFCAVRPPGHHAEVDCAMGFCYFNNIAIAARYLQKKWKIDRVAIIDFDVHHGNGTQHIFEKDPSVFYFSIHEHPSFAFPGTGRAFESGDGAGSGATLNLPILPGQGDSEYAAHFESDLLPALADFKPQFILISAGFDAHCEDDMSGVSLTTEGYTQIMETLFDAATAHTQGRLVSVLEGGYCLRRLGELASNHVDILLNR